ncbi:glycosyltransferase family 9 protein [Desulfovulcanus sp.]
MNFKAQNWLVVRLSALGDVVLTTGVLAYLGQAYNLNFYFLTKKNFAPVLENHPYIQKVISVTEQDLNLLTWLEQINKFKKECQHFGLLDLHQNLRSKILKFIWSGPVSSYPKFSLTRRAYLLTKSSLLQKRLKLNVPQRYVMALCEDPPNISELRPRVYLTEEEKLWAQEFVAGKSLKAPIISLHPYATHPAKSWPEKYWLKLIEMMDKHGLSWVVLGQNKRPLIPDHPHDLTNKTSLRQTIAIIAKSQHLITNDSGPMHLGTAVTVPVLALFGPTSKEWGFYPSGKKDMVVHLQLPCSPCSLHGQDKCKNDYKCMRDITPEMVFKLLLKRLTPKLSDSRSI